MDPRPEIAPVNRTVGALFGAFWLASGVVSVVAARSAPVTSSTGATLPGDFSVNLLHGVLMLVAGAALVAGSLASARTTRRVNLLVGLVWVVLDLIALATGTSSFNVLAINGHDADLLLVAALGLLAVALLLDLPRTAGHGPAYRTVRHGEGARYVDAGEVGSDR